MTSQIQEQVAMAVVVIPFIQEEPGAEFGRDYHPMGEDLCLLPCIEQVLDNFAHHPELFDGVFPLEDVALDEPSHNRI